MAKSSQPADKSAYMVEDVKAFHAAILQLLLSKFPKTAQTFSSESGVTSADVTATLKTEDLLQKKWLATSKLQMSLMVHEKQIAAKDLRLGVLEGMFHLRKVQEVKIPTNSITSKTQSSKLRKVDIVCSAPQSPTLITGSQSSNQIDVWSLDSTYEPVIYHNIKASGNLLAITFDPLGHILLVASAATTLEVFDVRTWAALHKLRTAGTTILRIHTYPHQSPNPFRYQTAFHTILVMRDLTVQMWDAINGACLKTTSATAGKAHLKGSCVVGSRYLCLGLDDGKITTFTLHDDDIQHGHDFQAHDRSVEILVPIDVGESKLHRFASAGRDSTVKIWNASSHSCIFELKGHHDWVRHLAVHPLGVVLASAGDDRSMKFWNIESGDLVKDLIEAHPMGLTGISFLSTGSTICTFSDKVPLMTWRCDQGLSDLTSIVSEQAEQVGRKTEGRRIESQDSTLMHSATTSTAAPSKEDLRPLDIQQGTPGASITPHSLASSLGSSPAAASTEKAVPTSSSKKAVASSSSHAKRHAPKHSGEAVSSPGASRASSSRENSGSKHSPLMQVESNANSTTTTTGTDKKSSDLKLKQKPAGLSGKENALRRLESSRVPDLIQSARGQPKTSHVSPRGPQPGRRESLPFNVTLGLRRSSTINSMQRMPTIKVQDSVTRATPDPAPSEVSASSEVPRPESARSTHVVANTPIPPAPIPADRAKHTNSERVMQAAPVERPPQSALDRHTTGAETEPVSHPVSKATDLLEAPTPGGVAMSSQESVAQELPVVGPISASESLASQNEMKPQTATDKGSKAVPESSGTSDGALLLAPIGSTHRKEPNTSSRTMFPKTTSATFAGSTSRASPSVASKQPSSTSGGAAQSTKRQSKSSGNAAAPKSSTAQSSQARHTVTSSSAASVSKPAPTNAQVLKAAPKIASSIPERPQQASSPPASTSQIPASQCIGASPMTSTKTTHGLGATSTSSTKHVSGTAPAPASSSKGFSSSTQKSSPKSKTSTAKASPTHAPASKPSNFAAPNRTSGGRVSPGTRTNTHSSSTRTAAAAASGQQSKSSATPATTANSSVKPAPNPVASKV